MEAKQIILFGGTALSYSFNRLLLKNESTFLIHFRLLAGYLLLLL
jgi:hypothetical protein